MPGLVQIDLQSIGSSPGLHILCARDTIMIQLTSRTLKGVLVSDLYFILCGGGYGCSLPLKL